MNCVVIFQFNLDVLVVAMCRKLAWGQIINVCEHLCSTTLAPKSGKYRGFKPLVICGLWEVDANSSKGAQGGGGRHFSYR